MAALYRQVKDAISGSTNTGVILRVADRAYIPNDAHNVDWKAYQAWTALGNTPDPA